MSSKLVIGFGPALEQALDAWRDVAPDMELRPIAVEQDARYAFDLRALDALDHIDRSQVSAFVACGEQFLNLRRLELMGEVRARGFAMPPLIGAGALVSSSAKLGENCWIGTGAIIGTACRIGFNTVIGAGANIGHGSHIGNSASLAAGIVIGRGARIASHATLGVGVIIADAVEIGKFSVIDKPGSINANVASKTFVHAGFDNPIVIVGQ